MRESRSRTIVCSAPLADEVLASLREDLLALEGVTRLERDGPRLRVDYRFPACSFARIWHLVRGAATGRRIGSLARLRCATAAFAEENERDHLLNPAHWYRYVRDLYARCGLAGSPAGAGEHRQPWRRHQGRR